MHSTCQSWRRRMPPAKADLTPAWRRRRAGGRVGFGNVLTTEEPLAAVWSRILVRSAPSAVGHAPFGATGVGFPKALACDNLLGRATPTMTMKDSEPTDCGG